MSDQGHNWVLKFISGKYQGGEFPLEEGKEYIIGRSSDSHMVLVEDMVSRHHAKLSVIDDQVHLGDMGSTNGSFVNGERVANCILKEGDRILFGTSIIKLMRVAPGKPVEQPYQPTEAKPRRTPSAEIVAQPTQAIRINTNATSVGAMTGQLEEVSLPDLLQLFSTSRKNGVLRIIADREACLYLKDGRIEFAEILDVPDLSAEKAAFRVMTWTSGTFVLEAPVERDFPEILDMSTEALMMESLRLFDEMENMSHKLPDPDTVLTIKRPLVPLLRELDPELLDVLQLVINYGMVETVLNKTSDGDLDTMRSIDKLMKLDYVEAVG